MPVLAVQTLGPEGGVLLPARRYVKRSQVTAAAGQPSARTQAHTLGPPQSYEYYERGCPMLDVAGGDACEWASMWNRLVVVVRS